MQIARLSCLIATLIASAVACPSLAGPDERKDFRWTSTPPLIVPPLGPQKYYGVKDPSVVYFDGKYHIFMTTAGENGWALAYTSFSDWSEASS